MTFKKYIGAKAEEYAEKRLEESGFLILKRNYCVHNVGEIDIIAEKGSDIHIIEVRARLNIGYYPDSAESVTGAKRNRVMKTAERFIIENDLYDRNIVFEVCSVTHDKQGNIQRIDFVPF